MRDEPHNVDIHVGKNIRVMRLMRRISQTELGERVGVTFQQIQKYEKGSNRVSASMLVEIAAALNVDVRNFFDNLDQSIKPSANGHDGDMGHSREGIILNAAYLSIRSPEIRKSILKMVQAIATQQALEEAEAGEDPA